MTPTAYMKCCGVTGSAPVNAGATYFGQNASRLKNLSSPARNGTNPKLKRNVHHTESTSFRSVASLSSVRFICPPDFLSPPRDRWLDFVTGHDRGAAFG